MLPGLHMDQLGIFLKFSVLALAISAAISQYRSGGGHQVLNHIQKQSVDMAQMTPAHGKVPPPSSSSSLRILCLGDSLTAGYTNWGMSFFPYSDTLTERLKDSLLSTDVHVDVDGFSGDQVRGQFVKRMQRSCEKAKANPYDWIIVLGGTNDLGWGQKPPEIFEGLKKVWSVALETGANLLALNVLEAAQSSAGMIQKRTDLNTMIMSHQEERFYTFDIWTKIRYNEVDEEFRARIWDDGLHLTQDGYELMGYAIADRLLELIKTP